MPLDAIYFDFESLGTDPPQPAIAGVLTERRGATTFEQVIVDPALARAAAARRQLRFAPLGDLVAQLLATDLPIVAWSFFDRDLVLGSDINAGLKRVWRERYVNALAVARTWRAKIHPHYKVAADTKFDAKHTLDKYAEFTGYSKVNALRGAAPAKWIRTALKQMQSRGQYRRLTATAQRDWRRLLDYNRHDCEALRHIYVKTSSELEKWRAYERTTYCVTEPGGRPICLRVGSANARLDALLDRYGATRWSFVTAWNPSSQPLPRGENDRRQTALLERLAADGYRTLRGEGRGQDASWPPEESALVLDIPKRVARKIGHDFGQLAIVVGYRGYPSRLVACA